MPDLPSPPIIGIDTTSTMPAASSGDTSAPSPSPTTPTPTPTPSKDGSTDTVALPSETTPAPKLEPDTEGEAEAETDGDGVISDIQGSDTSSSSGVSPGQTAMIALVVCAALAIGLVVLRRNLVSRSSWSSGSVSSGSEGPSQFDDSQVPSQFDDSQVDDSLA
jgi:hypothetical protein